MKLLHYQWMFKWRGRRVKVCYNFVVRVAVLCLFLFTLIGFTPILTVYADDGKELSDIVEFQNIGLYYTDENGQTGNEKLQDNAFIEKDRQLALCYTGLIGVEQYKNIVPDTRYHLYVSTHLSLSDLDKIPLAAANGDGQQKQLGAIYVNEGEAWIEFDVDEDNLDGDLLDYSGGFEVCFALKCRRADYPPESEQPVEEGRNLYVMKFADGFQFNFGYAEEETDEVKVQIQPDDSLEDDMPDQSSDVVPDQKLSDYNNLIEDSVWEDTYTQTKLSAAQETENADVKNKLSEIVIFQSIALYSVGSDGQPEGEQLGNKGDTVWIEKGKDLALRYEYQITEEQCSLIQEGVKYYLETPPHLALPQLAESGEPLMIESGEGKEQFGTLYSDGSKAWVTFNKTVLSGFAGDGGISGAYFYLNCRRADDPPENEQPIQGSDNLYLMKFENGSQFQFGYAENKPAAAEAQVQKGASLTDDRIKWKIEYTPWQNPSDADDVTMDSSFELRDRIDEVMHHYAANSVRIGGNPDPVTEYSSRDEIPADSPPEFYVIVQTVPDGAGTELIFGGTKLNAGKATQGNPAQALNITYETTIDRELLLPGGSDEKQVSNGVELFAGEDGTFHTVNITDKYDVSIPQPVWLEKTGETERHKDGTGSTTDWKIVFYPQGMTFDSSAALTLHDQIPAGSTLVEDSVTMGGTKVNVASDGKNGFTISPIIIPDAQSVTVEYQTKASEEMYENGTDLGSNTAWFTFHYGSKEYSTPKASTPVNSGNDSGTSETATLVKTNKGYNPADRTIEWTVSINPYRVYLRSGTFKDDLSGIGGVCDESGHISGLELTQKAEEISSSWLIDGKTPSEEDKKQVSFQYDNRVLTVEVGEIGAKTITFSYTTKVCDPCVFANNTKGAVFENRIVTNDMQIGKNTITTRKAEAASKADVSATVLLKNKPVYNYETREMEWTLEVNEAGLAMENVVLTDFLPIGLSYVKDSLSANPAGLSASVDESGNDLIIRLGSVTGKSIITFRTTIDPEALGFAGDKPVVVENTVSMKGSADGVPFAEVFHKADKEFVNHGLLKSGQVDKQKEQIHYEVLINPYGLSLPGNPSIIDTPDKRLQPDLDSLCFYKATVDGKTENTGQKPAYNKEGEGQPLKATSYDPAANSFTVPLPIEKNSKGAYVLTYNADILNWQTGGYGNNVCFAGGSVLLGGNKNNITVVSGGGAGGGGAVANRRAGITVIKTDDENQTPLEGVTFTLYQWDPDKDVRGLPFAQGTTDAQGRISFKVKPREVYELVETASIPGYSSAFRWGQLPVGATATDQGLLITAGEAKSELKLELTNKAGTQDIVFRLLNDSGIPMAGTKVQLFQADPTVAGDIVPDAEAVVLADGTVRFMGVRRGKTYFIRYPDKQVMTVEIPADANEKIKVTLPDGTQAVLTAAYQVVGTMEPDEQWALTVSKADDGGKPLAGAVIGIYAEKSCQTLLGSGVSGADGIILFDGLVKGQKYWLKEITAPSGYHIDSTVYEIDETNPAVTILNIRKMPAGETGVEEAGGTLTDSGFHSASSNPSDPAAFDNSDVRTDAGRTEAAVSHAAVGNSSASFDAEGKPNTPGGQSGRADNDFDIPQTGDNTPWLITIVLLSGIPLTGMALYQFMQRVDRKRKRVNFGFPILLRIIFGISGITLSFRFVELRSGNKFYEQIREESGMENDRQKNEYRENETEMSEFFTRFSQFAEEYPDAAAWIQIPGTPVDYPVMSGTDNQFFLGHLPDGSENAMGSLFTDYRVGMDSPHLIVYGHNGMGGKMFGSLRQYESQNYFTEHRTLTVALQDSVYVCPIFSVRRVEADSSVYQMDFEDQDALEEYADGAIKASIYPTGVNLSGIERILTLSTCTGRRGERLIVQAILPEQ